MKTATQTLRAAADHMARVGYHRGDAVADSRDRGNSPCCTIGAISIAAESDAEYREARAVLGEYLLTKLGWHGATSSWSDRQDQETCISAMREAALIAEPAGFEPRVIVFPSQRAW